MRSTDHDRSAELRETARLLRRDVVRMIHLAGDGHPGPSLSVVDIVTALFFGALRIDPARPRWDERDRFILPKGHACPVVYAALAGRLKGRDYFTYVVTGDGELEEGIVWEALMAASHYRTGRLIVIVDNNGMQSGAAALASTRKAVADTLLELAAEDPDVVLICSDSVLVIKGKVFAERYPDRFFTWGSPSKTPSAAQPDLPPAG